MHKLYGQYLVRLVYSYFIFKMFIGITMPLNRIDVPEGISTVIKKQMHSQVREVVLKNLASKEVKYNYFSIREAFGYIGDGLPVIDVHLRPGRDATRKQALVEGISEVLKETLNITKEDGYCLVRETPAHNHYTGGEPFPE